MTSVNWITIKIPFDAAHRLVGHQGKCRFLHGHGYKATINIMSEKLDELGMVSDFGDVKKLIKGWIDVHWDHNTLLHPNDYLLNWHNKDGSFDSQAYLKLFGRSDPYVMQCKGNPTAENMAKELHGVVVNLLTHLPVVVHSVEIQETENCSAMYEVL